LPTEWQRAARIPGLRQRIVEVLRNPANGALDIQLDILSRLLTHPANPDEDEWLAWAGYAFGLPAQRAGEPASATHTRTKV
jgi:hypothetical protein